MPSPPAPDRPPEPAGRPPQESDLFLRALKRLNRALPLPHTAKAHLRDWAFKAFPGLLRHTVRYQWWAAERDLDAGIEPIRDLVQVGAGPIAGSAQGAS